MNCVWAERLRMVVSLVGLDVGHLHLLFKWQDYFSGSLWINCVFLVGDITYIIFTVSIYSDSG